MKNILFFICLIIILQNKSAAQAYNPQINAGDIDPAPLAPGQNGSFQFLFAMTTDDDAPLVNGDALTITICMNNIAPATPGNEIADISGTYASRFTWVYSAVLNCYQGTQNQTLPAATGGTIIFNFRQINQVACSIGDQMGFQANIEPAGYMNGTNSTVDDQESAFTCVDAALPIELLEFDTRAIDNEKVLLTWRTATEKNNAYFSVQRSADGITWQEINQVEGAIHSTAIKDYADWDYAPFQGINYYRLKQYDIDGNFSFSPIKVEIINQNQNFSAFLYPNPGADKFHLQIERTSDQKYHINILNQLGIRMQAQIDEEGAFKGKMQYLIDTQDFPSGYYQVLITSENGNIIKALPLIKK